METFSALLALCAGNSPVTGEFPSQRPVTRTFNVFFDLRLNKRLSKQSWGWWFETPSRSLWRHCNETNAVLTGVYFGKHNCRDTYLTNLLFGWNAIFAINHQNSCVSGILSYRLSWENPAPGPVNECLEATEGIYNDAKIWGFDRQKVILAGNASTQRVVIPASHIQVLNHWGQDKMATISQTKFLKALTWLKIYEFWLTIYWNLFLMVPLKIFSTGSDNVLAPTTRKAIVGTNAG